MIQVQILVSELHKGHQGSDDVIKGQKQVFAYNSRMERATDTCMVSLCSSCHNASPDMQHNLLGSTCDLTWPWPDVKFSPQVKFWPFHFSMSPSTCIDAPWREEYEGAWIQPLACLVQKLFAKNVFAKKGYFGVCLPLAAKPLTLAQFWLHVSERTAQELSNVFICGLLTRKLSEIMVHFRKNIWKFSKFDL